MSKKLNLVEVKSALNEAVFQEVGNEDNHVTVKVTIYDQMRQLPPKQNTHNYFCIIVLLLYYCIIIITSLYCCCAQLLFDSTIDHFVFFLNRKLFLFSALSSYFIELIVTRNLPSPTISHNAHSLPIPHNLSPSTFSSNHYQPFPHYLTSLITTPWQYSMLHVTPPMEAPKEIKESPLCDHSGFIDVGPAATRYYSPLH